MSVIKARAQPHWCRPVEAAKAPFGEAAAGAWTGYWLRRNGDPGRVYVRRYSDSHRS